MPHPDIDSEHPLASGELRLVTRDVAMAPGEITTTRFLNSDLLAPNHAATSIAVVNEDDDFERDMERLSGCRGTAKLITNNDREAPVYVMEK